MAHLVEQKDIGKFSVCLYRESDESAHIIWSCDQTRLEVLYYDTVEEARPTYRTMYRMVHTVVCCMNMDPSVGNPIPNNPNCAHGASLRHVDGTCGLCVEDKVT